MHLLCLVEKLKHRFSLTNCEKFLQVHHDMSAPMQHYFIYTGHNSYLIGNQLNSECSEVPIINALENGVRGIELDLWPNSAKDNIQVYHGKYVFCTYILLAHLLIPRTQTVNCALQNTDPSRAIDEMLRVDQKARVR